MEIIKSSMAGTLESSDIQILIRKHNQVDNHIELDSPVKHLFEEEILSVISQVLQEHEVTGVYVKAIDKGALNCTIAARMQTALYRATEKSIKWEVL